MSLASSMIRVGVGIFMCAFVKDRRRSAAPRNSSRMKIEATPTQASSAGIDHGGNDVVAQVVAGALEFGQALEDHRQRAGGFARPHHVDVELGKIVGMGGQAVGQRLAALQHAQHVEHDDAERGLLGQFGGDGKRAVERHAGIEQRGKFLGEEQDVAALAAAERRQLDLDGRALLGWTPT